MESQIQSVSKGVIINAVNEYNNNITISAKNRQEASSFSKFIDWSKVVTKPKCQVLKTVTF